VQSQHFQCRTYMPSPEQVLFGGSFGNDYANE
jgi:hypothetical protein